MRAYTAGPSRTASVLGVLAALVGTASLSCTFEGEDLSDRRCENDSACTARFGEGYVCLASKYCARLTIQCDPGKSLDALGRHPDCDDGIFCNGPELCEPGNDDAGEDGCVPSTEEAFVDDGIACTVDLCDERNTQVIHDPSGCDCAGDFHCQELLNDPCSLAECDLATFTCTTTPQPPDTPCEDGVECTENTLCNDQGQCVFVEGTSTQSDELCADDIFCNGAEVCDFMNPEAEPFSGCIPGVPPTDLPESDDGIDCTEAFCDEMTDAVFQDPSACECQTPEDCSAGGCAVFFCNATTSFTCLRDPNGGLQPEGEPCSDGIACTANDECTPEGTCIGRPVNLFCEQSCAAGICDPGAKDAGTDGCVCP